MYRFYPLFYNEFYIFTRINYICATQYLWKFRVIFEYHNQMVVVSTNNHALVTSIIESNNESIWYFQLNLGCAASKSSFLLGDRRHWYFLCFELW